MKSYLFKLIFSIIILFSQYILADEHITCNNCSDFNATAKNSVPNIDGRYNVHIIDFNNDVLKSFKVTVVDITGTEPGVNLPRFRKYVRSVVTPLYLKNDFSQFVQNKQGIVYQASIMDIPPDVAQTGWDLFGDSARQNNFLQYVYQNPSLSDLFASTVNFLSAWAKVSFDIPITLSNGAVIVLSYDRTEFSNGNILVKYKINFEKSLDEFENPLVMPPPISGDGTDTQLNFINGTQTAVDFQAAATRSGYIVVSGGTGGKIITCTLSAGKITCIYTKPT